MTSKLVPFLTGDGLDDAGRTWADIIAYDDEAVEETHDFVQWLFPLPERSRAVPEAPVMTPSDLETLRASRLARERLLQGAARMLDFYRASRRWRVPHDHNHLRITRIIRSLRLIVGDEAADRFRREINALAEDAPIDPAARRYWEEA